ncbi:MAG: 30S ribosomal protein S6 [Thermomicrobiales bacterium]
MQARRLWYSHVSPATSAGKRIHLSASRTGPARNPAHGLAGQTQGEEAPLRGETRAPRTYELMVILHPELTEEDLPGAIEKVAGYLASAGGELAETLRESPWGRRRLAYPIRHGGRDLRDGFYVVYHYDLAPMNVNELERDLKLDERVIRYMVTNYEPQPVDPRVVEQQEIDAEDAAAAAYAASQVVAPVVEAAEDAADVEEAAEEAAEIEEAIAEAEAIIEEAAAEAEAESE